MVNSRFQLSQLYKFVIVELKNHVQILPILKINSFGLIINNNYQGFKSFFYYKKWIIVIILYLNYQNWIIVIILYLNTKVVLLGTKGLEEGGHMKVDHIRTCIAIYVKQWSCTIVIHPSKQTPFWGCGSCILFFMLRCTCSQWQN